MSSKKVYLSNGGQQDAEEFLRVLIEQLMFELPAGNTFVSVLQSFWGTEKTIRKFLGTPDGKCPRCKTYPGSTDEPFFTMKIKVPDFNCKMTMVIQTYPAADADPLISSVHPILLHVVRIGKGKRDQELEPVPTYFHLQT